MVMGLDKGVKVVFVFLVAGFETLEGRLKMNGEGVLQTFEA